MLGRTMHISCALLTGQLHHSYGNDDSEYIPFYHLGVHNEICTHYQRTYDILVHLDCLCNGIPYVQGKGEC